MDKRLIANIYNFIAMNKVTIADIGDRETSYYCGESLARSNLPVISMGRGKGHTTALLEFIKYNTRLTYGLVGVIDSSDYINLDNVHDITLRGLRQHGYGYINFDYIIFENVLNQNFTDIGLMLGVMTRLQNFKESRVGGIGC